MPIKFSKGLRETIRNTKKKDMEPLIKRIVEAAIDPVIKTGKVVAIDSFPILFDGLLPEKPEGKCLLTISCKPDKTFYLMDGERPREIPENFDNYLCKVEIRDFQGKGEVVRDGVASWAIDVDSVGQKKMLSVGRYCDLHLFFCELHKGMLVAFNTYPE